MKLLVKAKRDMKDEDRVIPPHFHIFSRGRNKETKEVFAVQCCTHSPDLTTVRLVACLSAAATEMLLAEPETARWMIHCQKAFLGRSCPGVLRSTVGSEGRWNDGRDYY